MAKLVPSLQSLVHIYKAQRHVKIQRVCSFRWLILNICDLHATQKVRSLQLKAKLVPYQSYVHIYKQSQTVVSN